MKTGIELFLKERLEQLNKHDRTIEQDVELNKDNQLSYAASCLSEEYIEFTNYKFEAPKNWDLRQWRKMYHKPYLERLVIAGALLAAELDRMAVVDPEGYEKLCKKYKTKSCDHDYSDGTGTGYNVCRKCGDMY